MRRKVIENSMKTLKSFWKVLPYIKPVQRGFWLSVFMALPMAAVRIGPVPLVKKLVDDLLVNKDASSLYLIPLSVIALFTLNLFIRFAHYFSNRVVVVGVNQAIREKLMKHMVNLSSDYFTSQRAGTLINRVAIDPAHVDGGVGSLNALIREPFTFLGLLGYAIYLNWKLTFITIVIVPPMALLFSWSGNYLKKRIKEYQALNGQMMSTVQESVQGIRIIHWFNLNDRLLQHFHEQMNRISKVLLRISKIEEFSHPGVEWISSVAIAIILYFGGQAVLAAEMTSGELISFFVAFAMMMNPLRTFSDINNKLHTSAAAMENIEDFLNWESKLPMAHSTKEFDGIKSGIQIQNLTFTYPAEPESVLRNVSFEFKKGETLALVGQSGSGKSTMVQLLTRMADPSIGDILIDGTPLRDLRLSRWRDHLAVVSQEVFLFHDTVFENIKMGRPNATDAEVREAASRAHATDFIDRLPQGINTMIGDRGMRLSGGERQRISIARAFLRNADFLILDEATSNLDTHSEQLVQAALEELMESKTVLLIAHRLSTVKRADRIIVLSRGEKVQEGSFDQLASQPGEFQKLLALSQ